MRAPTGIVQLITIAMATVIGADHLRVWRALTDPTELMTWDERILAPVDPPDRYPFKGQHVRWRYRLGSVQLVMHDRPLEVSAPERLRSVIRLGSMSYEQTFTLKSEDGAPHRTRLGMRVVASNSIPVVGDVVDRFAVRRMAAEHIDETLRSIQSFCENDSLQLHGVASAPKEGS
jgi:uncharacterized protein YndB with AHSA1/START domain